MKIQIFLKRIFLSNFKRLDFPYKLTFSVTNKCNSECKFCNIWKKDNIELTLGEINNFFEKSNKFSWIDLTGGEPFLRDDLYDIVKIIEKKCKNLYILHIPTNGIETRRIIETLKKISCSEIPKIIISVSIDGPETLHNKNRKADSWSKAVRTFNAIREIKNVSVYFGFTINSDNYNKFDETYSELKIHVKNLDHNDIHVNLVHKSFYYSNYHIQMPRSSDIIRNVRDIMRKRKLFFTPFLYLEHQYLKLIKEYLENRKEPLTCKAFHSSCFVNANGDVYPCNSYDKLIGNIKESDYDMENEY